MKAKKNNKNINNNTQEQENNAQSTLENEAQEDVKQQDNEQQHSQEESSEQEEKVDPTAKAQQEAEQWKDKYIRLVAEFDNYKKRTLKEKSELIINGSEKTINAVLPILDDFERALSDNTEDPNSIKEGFNLIYKKFVETLKKIGVQKIDTDNADFNVDYHEAIAMVPGMGDEKKGKIIDCVQTGYTLNDKVIRHAKVAVGQ
ncbi:nucleotide exchange factor GrpE [Prevotella amnii]|uniref:Protein GrpE n=2 Tax=Prevotella amnii TaxID=419005 RepID=A0A096AYL9_9BACT|nr:nucleotide exchange factor GrpE [Prevotella amnii]EFN90666.1 co-chaperone GrpE [Prevotella amnii CRIS 21A-A]KGF51910.1 molecular chaperone GrpE [Prevotella amnii DNF00058]